METVFLLSLSKGALKEDALKGVEELAIDSDGLGTDGVIFWFVRCRE